MKILLVYNPHAGHNRAGKLLPQVEAMFRQKNVEFDLRLTARPGHAVDIVREAHLKSYDGVVAAGGDGTLFEVINGYYQNPLTDRVPIGVLPIGTGNAFARDMDLNNTKWTEAIDIIASGKTKKVDVGKFTTADRTFYFLNIIGLGFVADVVKTAYQLKGLGNVAYTIGVFHRMIMLKSTRIKVVLDGKALELDNVFTEVSNTRYTSNFYMAPNAKIDDGLFDVTLLGKTTRRRLLQCFPKIFTGEHIHMAEVEQIQAKSIRIEADVPKVLTPDGELLGSTPVTIECLHRAVEVFWQ
jgi:diacylglycerol kinase (ATP)